ncbi:MAG: acetate kinase [Aestuariivirga sp.]|uniref:acetate/propionate family kinase n=1 Tax=Aestuariivirga sp. TaxID=2650926 RepID=UPI003017D4B8
MSRPALLTLNAGSSSLKFALFPAEGDQPLASGLADRIGPEGTLSIKAADGTALIGAEHPNVSSHAAALRSALAILLAAFPDLEITAVGHRVVHGGPDHAAPLLLDEARIAELARLEPFAPLHQPHNLAGVRAAMEAFPRAAQVACFDTAFHRSHPFVNDTFALPRSYYEKGIRRYGFHGLSYEYIAGEIARIAPRLAEGKLVVAHLGNGASVCAIQNGKSVASTMGFSALDGLPMGTRSGQIDPGVILYLMDQEGLSAAAISDLLYKKSGLLGMSGLSNDMRVLEAATDPHAAEAIDYFVFRVQREIGAMAAALGGIDALVFCGGIGENARGIRARICSRMAWMGIELDHARNEANSQVISSELARAQVMVIRTNEELVIARAVRTMVNHSERSAA